MSRPQWPDSHEPPSEIPGTIHYPLPAFLVDGELTVIKTNGSFVRIATDTRILTERDTVDRLARGATGSEDRPLTALEVQPSSPTDWLVGHVLTGHDAAVSSDGSRMFINSPSKGFAASEFVILNPLTLERIGSIPYERRFNSFTISGDSACVYAVDADKDELVVIDTRSGVELRSVSGVGPRPAFGVVVP